MIGLVVAGRTLVVATVVRHRENRVFELGAVPRVRRVALGALGAEAPLVDLRLGVAGHTGLRGPEEGIVVLVARPAVGGLMFAGQLEGRQIVIEAGQAGQIDRGCRPRVGRVTLGAGPERLRTAAFPFAASFIGLPLAALLVMGVWLPPGLRDGFVAAAGVLGIAP